MAQSSIDPFEAISFGFNERSFYLRIEPIEHEKGFVLAKDDHVSIGVHSEHGHKWFELSTDEEGTKLCPVDDSGKRSDLPGPEFAAKTIFEVCFNFADLGLKAGDRTTVTIALYRKGVEIRRYSHMQFVVPDAMYERRMWGV